MIMNAILGDRSAAREARIGRRAWLCPIGTQIGAQPGNVPAQARLIGRLLANHSPSCDDFRCVKGSALPGRVSRPVGPVSDFGERSGSEHTHSRAVRCGQHRHAQRRDLRTRRRTGGMYPWWRCSGRSDHEVRPMHLWRSLGIQNRPALFSTHGRPHGRRRRTQRAFYRFRILSHTRCRRL